MSEKINTSNSYWEDKTINDAEKAYYAEVSVKISQKLLEAVAEY